MTKKMINAAAKYIVVIDYKAQHGGLEYKTLKAENILEAMREAEMMFNETVYLINIAEKTRETSGDCIVYKEVLTTRGHENWHMCDKAHSEVPAKIAHNVHYDYYEIIY